MINSNTTSCHFNVMFGHESLWCNCRSKRTIQTSWRMFETWVLMSTPWLFSLLDAPSPHSPLQRLNSAPERRHNVANASYLVKLSLELINLS